MMKDDDPEKRIRDLERELADMNRPPQSIPPYTGDASPYTSDAPPPAVDTPYAANPYGAPPPAVDLPYTSNPYEGSAPYTAPSQSFSSDAPPSYPTNPPYAGNTPYVGDPTWGVNFRPSRRRPPWVVVSLAVGTIVPAIFGIVGHSWTSHRTGSSFGSSFGPSIGSMATAPNGPTAVPPGGELQVGGNNEGRTVDCNGGKLTLVGTNTDYYVTGKCASLTVGGFSNTVRVDSIDAVESTGYNNTVTVQSCNNGALTVSSYGIKFDVTGHCASLAISSYDNNVTVGSVDSINVSGYDNVVTYHSGKPTITDSGNNNRIHLG
jgi:Protein of unknown function (DUF3060)